MINAPQPRNEFESLREVAQALGIPRESTLSADRTWVEVEQGQISAVRWGSEPAEIVFLHGGGQNAHTWDTVAMILGRPAVAIDLPGHGHSSWRDDKDYRPIANAQSVAPVIAQLAPSADLVVGMSLGGLTLARLMGTHPGLIRRAIIVDTLPRRPGGLSSLTPEQQGAVSLIRGPRSYSNFEAMLAAAVATSPHRDQAALARGVLNNSVQDPDGTWRWRYDSLERVADADFASLWHDIGRSSSPLTLVRGGESRFVRTEQLEKLHEVRPDAHVVVIDGAGHSVQSDRPAQLASVIQEFRMT